MFPKKCKKCGEKFQPTGRQNYLCIECFDKIRRQRKSDIPMEERARLQKFLWKKGIDYKKNIEVRDILD